MKKFEYFCTIIVENVEPMETRLNRLGAIGWELVNTYEYVDCIHCILKREIEEK